MPDERILTKAILQKISWNSDGDPIVREDRDQFEVQFNPETLTVAMSNQVSGGDQAGGSAIQFNSKGTTNLTFDLVFDSTDPKIQTRFSKDVKPEALNDVRRITKLVADFMQTEPTGSGRETRYVPSGIRFSWGTFRFDGVVTTVNETVEFFSEDGIPLRSKLSVTITKQDVDVNFNGDPSTPGASQTPTAGANDSVSDVIAQNNGNPENWQGDALANGIENPRDIPAGTPLNFGSSAAASLNAGLSASAGLSGSLSAELSGGASFGGSASLSASASLGAGASLGIGGSLGAGASIGAGASFGAGASVGAGASFGANASLGGSSGASLGASYDGPDVSISAESSFNTNLSTALALDGESFASEELSANFESGF